jgi:Tfp pilus assembly protein PilN
MGLVMSSFQMMALVLFMVGILISGTLISLRLMLERNFEEVKQQTTDVSSGPVEVQAAIKDINVHLGKVSARQAAHVAWSETIEDIAQLVPSGARVTKLVVDMEGNISITGTAATRDDALAFLENLKQAPYLTDVVSPLSNILQKYNVLFDFQMRFVPPAAEAES